ncbi:hypothetical protein NDU88_010466 [Pleurodeles waltl]|uniref:Uncharacterized protein n=1 Tax=Pleurodeles waltl TaxID=8319 RepID=A0AAV7QUI4_PLEWA|nr:hypothetical protein NDU88_010466 [Pleurodeles waltl]
MASPWRLGSPSESRAGASQEELTHCALAEMAVGLCLQTSIKAIKRHVLGNVNTIKSVVGTSKSPTSKSSFDEAVWLNFVLGASILNSNIGTENKRLETTDPPASSWERSIAIGRATPFFLQRRADSAVWRKPDILAF